MSHFAGVLAIALAFPVEDAAQTRSTRVTRTAANQITPTFVRDTLRGKTVDQWTFMSDELLEVDIISKKAVGRKIVAIVWVNTSDAQNSQRWEGRLRLTYDRAGRYALYLANVEGLTFGPKGAANAESYVFQNRPRQPISIASGTHHVKASGWLTWDFFIQENTHVTGRFVGEGGGVQGFIFDTDEYVNWSNSNSYRSYYRSGDVTIGNVNVVLPPGSYKFVVYNANILSAKTVSVNLSTSPQR